MYTKKVFEHTKMVFYHTLTHKKFFGQHLKKLIFFGVFVHKKNVPNTPKGVFDTQKSSNLLNYHQVEITAAELNYTCEYKINIF